MKYLIPIIVVGILLISGFVTATIPKEMPIIDNDPPSASEITGPVLIRPPGPYNWTFKAIDPDGDDVYYYIDWDDGNVEEWIGPYASGKKVTRSHSYSEKRTFEIKARAKDIYGAVGEWGYLRLVKSKSVKDTRQSLTSLSICQITMNVISLTGYNYIGVNQLLSELIIDGPTHGNLGEELMYSLLLTNQEGCNDIWYYADWGDGTYFDWWGPVHSGIYLGLIHAWDEGGVYIILAKAKDCEGSIYNSTFEVTINGKPDKPNIYGPVEGKKGEEYEFVFSTEDPEGDNVSYYVEWQDGTSTGWTDYFASGGDVKVKHVWKHVDDYRLRCKAKDIYGAESDWSYYEITIPKSKQIFNLPFLQFLMSIFQFPLLQQLLEFIWNIASEPYGI